MSDAFEPPVAFVELDAEWGLAVGRQFARIAAGTASDPVVDDLWLDRELGLCVRYRIADDLLAARHTRLDVDPTSNREPRDSATLASDLFHNLHAEEDDRPHVDADGYRWWGEPPAGGWRKPAPRIATFLP